MFNEPAEFFTVVCFSKLFYQVIDFKVQLLDHTASWPPGLPEETRWFDGLGFEDSSFKVVVSNMLENLGKIPILTGLKPPSTGSKLCFTDRSSRSCHLWAFVVWTPQMRPNDHASWRWEVLLQEWWSQEKSWHSVKLKLKLNEIDVYLCLS